MYDYDGIEERLQALRALVAEIAPDLAGWFEEYVDVGEYGLAVEIVAEQLPSSSDEPLVREVATALLAEAEVMGLADATTAPLSALARNRGRPPEG